MSLQNHKGAMCCRGLDYLRPLANLEELDLSDTGVSDNGVPFLGRLTKMRTLGVSYTGRALHSENRILRLQLQFSLQLFSYDRILLDV